MPSLPHVPPAVSALLGTVVGESELFDGCISRTRRLVTVDGRSVVLKERADAPPDLYRYEAEALAALAPRCACRRCSAAARRGCCWKTSAPRPG